MRGERGGLGLFTRNASGCGPAAALILESNAGAVAVNDLSSGIAPGGYLAFFGSGLWPLYNPPPDGEPAPCILSPSP